MKRNLLLILTTFMIVLLSGVLLVSGLSCVNSCESGNQMNVDIQLVAYGSHIRITNNNNFSLKNIQLELTTNVSESPFINQYTLLFPTDTRTYTLSNFKNVDGEHFNFEEMEILGISMYAETVEGEILTAEWDFKQN